MEASGAVLRALYEPSCVSFSLPATRSVSRARPCLSRAQDAHRAGFSFALATVCDYSFLCEMVCLMPASPTLLKVPWARSIWSLTRLTSHPDVPCSGGFSGIWTYSANTNKVPSRSGQWSPYKSLGFKEPRWRPSIRHVLSSKAFLHACSVPGNQLVRSRGLRKVTPAARAGDGG